ncbi:MAG: hypothetical protein ACLTEE_08955 [Anaerobutyricum hallii]
MKQNSLPKKEELAVKKEDLNKETKGMGYFEREKSAFSPTCVAMLVHTNT